MPSSSYSSPLAPLPVNEDAVFVEGLPTTPRSESNGRIMKQNRRMFYIPACLKRPYLRLEVRVDASESRALLLPDFIHYLCFNDLRMV